MNEQEFRNMLDAMCGEDPRVQFDDPEVAQRLWDVMAQQPQASQAIVGLYVTLSMALVGLLIHNKPKAAANLLMNAAVPTCGKLLDALVVDNRATISHDASALTYRIMKGDAEAIGCLAAIMSGDFSEDGREACRRRGGPNAQG